MLCLDEKGCLIHPFKQIKVRSAIKIKWVCLPVFSAPWNKPATVGIIVSIRGVDLCVIVLGVEATVSYWKKIDKHTVFLVTVVTAERHKQLVLINVSLVIPIQCSTQ